MYSKYATVYWIDLLSSMYTEKSYKRPPHIFSSPEPLGSHGELIGWP